MAILTQLPGCAPTSREQRATLRGPLMAPRGRQSLPPPPLSRSQLARGAQRCDRPAPRPRHRRRGRLLVHQRMDDLAVPTSPITEPAAGCACCRVRTKRGWAASTPVPPAKAPAVISNSIERMGNPIERMGFPIEPTRSPIELHGVAPIESMRFLPHRDDEEPHRSRCESPSTEIDEEPHRVDAKPHRDIDGGTGGASKPMRSLPTETMRNRIRVDADFRPIETMRNPIETMRSPMPSTMREPHRETMRDRRLDPAVSFAQRRFGGAPARLAPRYTPLLRRFPPRCDAPPPLIPRETTPSAPSSPWPAGCNPLPAERTGGRTVLPGPEGQVPRKVRRS